jgi:hypothetical protein
MDEFKISDLFFKIIISSSLPPSWDNFTQAYIAEVHCYATHNPFKDITSQEFIGVIKSEVKQCGKLNKFKSSNVTNAKGKKKKKPLLFKHISNRMKGIKIKETDDENTKENTEQKPKRPFCKHCRKYGHATDDCFLWDQDKCTHCSKSNHLSADCYYKDKLKEQNKKGKAKENSHKCSRSEEANAADTNQSYAAINEVGEVTSGGITFDTLENGQFFNFSNNNVANYSVNDKSTLYYDWLANSMTTSHITN